MSGSTNGTAGHRAATAARRTFLALPLPPAARRELARLTESALAAHAPQLRLVDPAGYHATVHFFGPLPGDELRRAQALCGPVVEALAAPVRCRLAGLAQLPPRGPARVVCAVFGDGHDTLAAFLAEARNRIAAAAFPVAARSPLPHVTVARVRHGRRWRMTERAALPGAGPERAAGTVRRGIDFRRLAGGGEYAPAPFFLDQLVLFESRLHPSGARYVPLISRHPTTAR